MSEKMQQETTYLISRLVKMKPTMWSHLQLEEERRSHRWHEQSRRRRNKKVCFNCPGYFLSGGGRSCPQLSPSSRDIRGAGWFTGATGKISSGRKWCPEDGMLFGDERQSWHRQNRTKDLHMHTPSPLCLIFVLLCRRKRNKQTRCSQDPFTVWWVLGVRQWTNVKFEQK